MELEDKEKEWDSDKVFEMIRIIERLKKLIEEFKTKKVSAYVINELQKILGEENGTN